MHELFVDQIHVVPKATKEGLKLGWHLIHVLTVVFGAETTKQTRLQVHLKNDASLFYSKATFDDWGQFFQGRFLPPAGEQWTELDAPSKGYKVSCQPRPPQSATPQATQPTQPAPPYAPSLACPLHSLPQPLCPFSLPPPTPASLR